MKLKHRCDLVRTENVMEPYGHSRSHPQSNRDQLRLQPNVSWINTWLNGIRLQYQMDATGLSASLSSGPSFERGLLATLTQALGNSPQSSSSRHVRTSSKARPDANVSSQYLYEFESNLIFITFQLVLLLPCLQLKLVENEWPNI